MSKIIWKDIDSSTIKGLLICELPPITKPKMRVQETTVDGVDGSIIEELGYESYDKSIRIGLTRDYDIDEVIKYFTGEGNVVFSNEPNKYYKARIIEQIDYERLLRFKEAVVKFRVQPFKYEYQEEETVFSEQEILENSKNLLEFDEKVSFIANNTYTSIPKSVNPFTEGAGKYNYSCISAIGTSYKIWVYNNNNILIKNIRAGYTFEMTEEEIESVSRVEIVIEGLIPGKLYESYIYPKINFGEYVDNSLIVNNLGNYFSKPLITIAGTGTIEFIVNGNKLFRYIFPEGEDTVVIDSQKQDAYFGNVLKNRNMSGEFPIFITGKNIIDLDGDVINIKISSKSRWL